VARHQRHPIARLDLDRPLEARFALFSLVVGIYFVLGAGDSLPSLQAALASAVASAQG